MPGQGHFLIFNLFIGTNNFSARLSSSQAGDFVVAGREVEKVFLASQTGQKIKRSEIVKLLN